MNERRYRICAVIVLYQEQAADSRTVRSLQYALSQRPGIAHEFLICVYDNSPEPSPLPDDLLPGRVIHFQPHRNAGLAEAYNAALSVARTQNVPWLLLLDSDTEVTGSFLEACLEVSMDIEGRKEIAAMVPHVVEGATIHSPRKAGVLRRKPLGIRLSGVSSREVVALNSGSVLRVLALEAIGGFNSEFWLDYLDYWLFRSLQSRGYRIYVLPEQLQHTLSFADPIGRMSLDRYRNMLEAESHFTIRYGFWWERIRLKLVLIKRALKFACHSNYKFASLTLQQLFRNNESKTQHSF